MSTWLHQGPMGLRSLWDAKHFSSHLLRRAPALVLYVCKSNKQGSGLSNTQFYSCIPQPL